MVDSRAECFGIFSNVPPGETFDERTQRYIQRRNYFLGLLDRSKYLLRLLEEFE